MRDDVREQSKRERGGEEERDVLISPAHVTRPLRNWLANCVQG